MQRILARALRLLQASLYTDIGCCTFLQISSFIRLVVTVVLLLQLRINSSWKVQLTRATGAVHLCHQPFQRMCRGYRRCSRGWSRHGAGRHVVNVLRVLQVTASNKVCTKTDSCQHTCWTQTANLKEHGNHVSVQAKQELYAYFKVFLVPTQ